SVAVLLVCVLLFFSLTSMTDFSTLSLHDALPICLCCLFLLLLLADRQCGRALDLRQSHVSRLGVARVRERLQEAFQEEHRLLRLDRKSTRLNSSHEWISYAVFCSKKKRFLVSWSF